jgi:hypothetical protein
MKGWIWRYALPAAWLALAGLGCGEKENPGAPSGYDLDKNPPPRFVRVNFLDVGRMARISRFRSAAGSDYSDDFETCRSMLHFFEPRADFDWSTLLLYSPVAGKVVSITREHTSALIVIRSLEYPDFEFHLGGIRPLDSLAAGKTLQAGEVIGTPAATPALSSIAVHVHSTSGRRLISWFSLIADSLWSTYGDCGVSTLDDFIISREARNADPLTCTGAAFASGGHLENWVDLNCHWDVDTWGYPRFVNVNYIDLDRIYKISRFRSAVGHDYPDDDESCRSMKHYFWLDGESGWETARLYAPVNGTVVWRFEEWLGTQLWIQSDDYPDFQFGIFHVVLRDSTLAEGCKVFAGQLLGTHYGTRTYSDIAVAVITPRHRKLISYFDILTDDLFQRYQARGLQDRRDMIISEAERDAFPLTCSGESFIAGTGVLEDWVTLK